MTFTLEIRVRALALLMAVIVMDVTWMKMACRPVQPTVHAWGLTSQEGLRHASVIQGG